jgi:hypothetical protein
VPWKRKAISFEPWIGPDWDKKPVAECLEELHRYVEQQAWREIGWYARNSARVRRASRWLRLWTLGFTAAGGLVPILSAMGLLEPLGQGLGGAMGLADVKIDQLGYLCLAAAASFALLDRFFGFSTAWMRYVATMVRLEKLREAYRLDWTALHRGLHADPGPEPVARMIERSRAFLVQMKEQTEQETQAWISEFQTNLSQFEKDLRTQLEASRPGAIDVRVSDGQRAPDGFALALDQMVVETVTGTSGSIGNVAPGLHKISATARLGGATYTASQIVTVAPATVAKLELTLGIPDPDRPA